MIFITKKTKENRAIYKIFGIKFSFIPKPKKYKPFVINKINHKSNSRVIYTCITGNYDELIQHNCTNLNYDYICFTDNDELLKQQKVGTWEIKPLFFDKLDDTKNARWHKTHPHILFPNYEYSIWIDSNGNILSDKIFNIAEKDLLIPKHFSRNCIYDEALACIIGKKETLHNISAIVDILEENKMPKNYGLNETNILLRRHNVPQIIKLMDEWWSYIEKYTKRDQLSLSYVLWKNDISIDDISFKNARFDNGNFQFLDHSGVAR